MQSLKLQRGPARGRSAADAALARSNAAAGAKQRAALRWLVRVAQIPPAGAERAAKPLVNGAVGFLPRHVGAGAPAAQPATLPAFPALSQKERSSWQQQHEQQQDQPPPPLRPAAAAAASTAAAAAVIAAPAPSAKASPRLGDLAQRVASGVLLGAAGAAVVAAGGAPFLAAALFVGLQSAREYQGMAAAAAAARGAQPLPKAVAALAPALSVALVPAAAAAGGSSGAVLCLAGAALLAVRLAVERKPSFEGCSSALFGLFYCGYLPSFWVKLRALDTPLLAVGGGLLPSVTVGLAATLTTVLCIVAADTGAYLTGRCLGRTKLTDISPKKTVEGAAGGLACAVAAALAARAVFLPAAGGAAVTAAAAAYGAVVFAVSLFGDLLESLMKRDAGMKDSGSLIPGHGGLLDRFDSYMFVGAVAWAFASALV